MKINRKMILSLIATALAGLALALCPGPVAAQWNPNEGSCVEGFWVWYCQDTELVSDGSCSGSNQPYTCYVSSQPHLKDKRIYAPYYSGDCNDPGNFCVDVTTPPVSQIPWHSTLIGLKTCP